MSNPKLVTRMLAFSRSVQITEALLWALKDDGARTPIEVVEKGVRGQISEANAKKNEGKSNPQTVDSASIPSGFGRLSITFGLRVMPSVMQPHASDNSDVAAAFCQAAREYAGKGGFAFLAERYVWNILNGRFAWRNRLQSDDAKIIVKLADLKIVADPLMLSLRDPQSRDEMAAAVIEGAEHLDALIDAVAKGFCERAVDIEVEWQSVLPGGAEVWPSQEYLRSEVAGALGNKGRVYASIPCATVRGRVPQASIHSQKIGAALRHIDDWHGDAENGAIAVNPYGGVQETGAVLRPLKKGDAANFYDIMKKDSEIFADLERPAAEMSGNTHFFFANLLRGGVFGMSDGKADGKAGSEKKD